MKKLILISVLVIGVLLIGGCSGSPKTVDTKSIIVNKEVVSSNQYYFYVTYKITGMDGDFEATIKVKNQTEYDRYNVGDEYIFKRPVTK